MLLSYWVTGESRERLGAAASPGALLSIALSRCWGGSSKEIGGRRWIYSCTQKKEPKGLSLRIGGGRPDSKASATVHHHGRDLAVDDLLLLVKVEHVDGGHLGGGAAWAGGPSGRGPVDQVGVRVLLQVHVLALARAVVGLVALGGDNPVKAKVLKVHGERVAAAT